MADRIDDGAGAAHEHDDFDNDALDLAILEEDEALDRGAADDASIKALVGLVPIEYDRRREEEAKRLGVRVATLDRLVGEARKRPRLSEAARSIVERATQDGKSTPGELMAAAPVLSEDCIAEVFAELHRDRLRYDHDHGRWYLWTGCRWQCQTSPLAFAWVRESCRIAAEQAPDTQSAVTLGKAATARGVETFARCDQRLAVTSEGWDAEPFLLSTPAGPVDLRTGELRAADPAERITKITAVAPSPTPDCPRWLRFLHEACGDAKDLVLFLQRVAGYCLTGDTREHALFFVYGPGGNGKSVWLNVLRAILADYAKTAAMDSFTASKHEQHPTDLAMLQGARLVTASETENGRAWAEARIKQLTGGDPIAARFMRRDFFEFRPVFKLLIVGNHQPVLHNVDDAMRRRLHVIPFTQKPEHPDKELEHKLRDEWSGILRWMIDGCLAWQRIGLEPPELVTATTADYFAEQDLIGQWIDERCDLGRREFEATAKLYADWASFARKAGEETGTKKAFGAALLKRGFLPARDPAGTKRIYRGLALRFDHGASGISHD